MKILAIETSCDETAASVVEIKAGKFKILSQIISSQIDIHQKNRWHCARGSSQRTCKKYFTCD